MANQQFGDFNFLGTEGTNEAPQPSAFQDRKWMTGKERIGSEKRGEMLPLDLLTTELYQYAPHIPSLGQFGGYYEQNESQNVLQQQDMQQFQQMQQQQHQNQQLHPQQYQMPQLRQMQQLPQLQNFQVQPQQLNGHHSLLGQQLQQLQQQPSSMSLGYPGFTPQYQSNNVLNEMKLNVPFTSQGQIHSQFDQFTTDPQLEQYFKQSFQPGTISGGQDVKLPGSEPVQPVHREPAAEQTPEEFKDDTKQERFTKVKSGGISKPKSKLKVKGSVPAGAFAPGNFKKAKDEPAETKPDGHKDLEEAFQKRLETLPEELSKSQSGTKDLKYLVASAIQEFKQQDFSQEGLMNRLALLLTCFEKSTWGKTPDWRVFCLKFILDNMNEGKEGLNFKSAYARKNKLFNRISNWLRFDLMNKNYDSLEVTLKFLSKVSLSAAALENHKMMAPLNKILQLDGQKAVSSLASEILKSIATSKDSVTKPTTTNKAAVKQTPKTTAKATSKPAPAKLSMFSKSSQSKVTKPERKQVKRPLLGSLLPESLSSPPASTPPKTPEPQVKTHAHSPATSLTSADSPTALTPTSARSLTQETTKCDIQEVNEDPRITPEGLRSILRRENDQATTKRKRRAVSLKWKDEYTNDADSLATVRFFEFDPDERRLDSRELAGIGSKERIKKDVPDSVAFQFRSKPYEGSAPDTPPKKTYAKEENERKEWSLPIEIDFKNIPWFEYVEDNAETRAGGETPVESEEAEIQKAREALVEEVSDTQGEIQEPLDGGMSGMRPDSNNGLVLNARILNPLGELKA